MIKVRSTVQNRKKICQQISKITQNEKHQVQKEGQEPTTQYKNTTKPIQTISQNTDKRMYRKKDHV